MNKTPLGRSFKKKQPQNKNLPAENQGKWKFLQKFPETPISDKMVRNFSGFLKRKKVVNVNLILPIWALHEAPKEEILLFWVSWKMMYFSAGTGQKKSKNNSIVGEVKKVFGASLLLFHFPPGGSATFWGHAVPEGGWGQCRAKPLPKIFFHLPWFLGPIFGGMVFNRLFLFSMSQLLSLQQRSNNKGEVHIWWRNKMLSSHGNKQQILGIEEVPDFGIKCL